MQSLPGVKSFKFYTGKSFSFHTILIVLALGFSAWQWSNLDKQRKANIKLVQSSVRVDVVAMPKKTFQELKALQSVAVEEKPAPAKPAAPEPKVETPDTGKEFIKEKKKTSFADLMKQYSKDKVEDVKPAKAKKKEERIDSQSLAKLQGLIKRGNKVREGKGLVGNGASGDLNALQEYAAGLPAIVKPFWKLPSYLASENYQCRIQVFINSQGKLLKAVVYEKSENPEYDQRAINAVKQASPFPAPAADLAAMTARGDILLGFPL